MTAGERFKIWIDGLAEDWKDRLRDWMASWLAWGIELILDTIGRGMGKRLDTIIDVYAMENEIPSDVVAKLKDAWKGEGEWQALLGYSAGGTAVGSLIGSTIGPWLKLLEYKGLGLAKPYRLDPLAVITAWRRDKPAYEKLFDDLRDQGWNDERIEALKYLTLFYPAPADLIHWQAREVFEPEMIARYGLDDEFGAIEKEPFYKAGMTDEQILNYWRAHWEHASWQQVVEMLHRGQLTEEEVWDWFRVVEIPPFWRDKLIAISWNVPTRVDVRRFWDMRTITEERLREVYAAQGYHGKDLDDYVLWTKVYVAYPDLLARWSKGWITMDDVRSELVGLGMPAARVEEMIQTKIKPAESERVSSERDLTKTDIYKGVKQGVLARGEGIELLMDLGFDEDEADYLLAINIPTDETAAVVSERQLSKTDILNGLKTEVITRTEALDKLLGLRYSATDAEFLLKIYDAQVKPPTEAREREASKADIVLGVKKGLITQEEAYGMLLDLGFTAEAAQFILMVKTEESPFSPIDYAEFKDLTRKYRVAAGREAKPMSKEIIAAGAEVVKLTSDVKALQTTLKAEERKLIAQEVLPEAATAKRDELRVMLHRAESELRAAQVNYDSLVAQWRHGG